MTTPTFSAIEVAAHDDGTYRLHIGGVAVASYGTQLEAAQAAVPVRIAYSQGRKDQRVETATLLKGIMATP